MSNEIMTAWHYTNGTFLYRIAKSRILTCATALLSEGEIPVLWFTINQKWEPTVNANQLNSDCTLHKRYTMLETREQYNGLFRFGVPSNRLIPWIELVKVANISSKERKWLEKTGRKVGSNPYHWFGSLQPIDIRETIIEGMNDSYEWHNIAEQIEEMGDLDLPPDADGSFRNLKNRVELAWR